MYNKKDDKTLANDWSRVAGNPDNVIISEALVDRVDPYNLGEIANPKNAIPECEFKFEDYTITGNVTGFSRVDENISYTFTTTPAQACLLMNRSKLHSFAVATSDDTSLGVDDAATLGKFNFEVEVESNHTAIIVVSFTEAS